MDGATEFRFAPGSLEGRSLSGVLLRYGELSPSHRERFAPGALVPADHLSLNLGHRGREVVAFHPGGGLIVEAGDEAVRLSATLPMTPAGDAAKAMIEAGGGLSVEFRATSERREAGVRVIERAELVGAGIVAQPSYPSSRAELRGRAGGVSGIIPYGRQLRCECHAGPEDTIQFQPNALKFAETVLLQMGDQGKALASLSKGSLRLRQTREGVIIEADLPDTQAARDLLAMAAGVPLIVRPVFDTELSRFIVRGEVALYLLAVVKRLLIGTTVAREGWPEVTFGGSENDDDD